MKSQHPHRRHRVIAAALAGLCLTVPASANAIPHGDTKYDYPSAAMSPAVTTPAAQAEPAAATPAEPRGDTKFDAPGASRAPAYAAPPIHVFRPETTIVRSVDAALPIVLSGAALLLALCGVGIALLGTGSMPRLRRSH